MTVGEYIKQESRAILQTGWDEVIAHSELAPDDDLPEKFTVLGNYNTIYRRFYLFFTLLDPSLARQALRTGSMWDRKVAPSSNNSTPAYAIPEIKYTCVERKP